MKDWIIKAILLVIATPFIGALAMTVVIFFAWPIFCIGLIICYLVSMFSSTAALILFILMLIFVLILILAKSL